MRKDEPPLRSKCPDCGEPLLKSTRRCPECGRVLGGRDYRDTMARVNYGKGRR